jgi:hypothetical protein
MVIFLAATLTGCTSETTTNRPGNPQHKSTSSNTVAKTPARNAALSPSDPCPERLHDLAGALLNFLEQYNRLPPTLEDLPPIKGEAPLALTCPQTNQKYIYNPNGINFPPNRWVVVYDASPSHNGYRWGIAFSDPGKPGQAPIPSVLAISESEFKAANELPAGSK